MVRLPRLLDGLEEDQRIAAAIAQLVLGQVRGDGVDPGRELLGLIEAMQMPVDPDEHFLHQVFGALPITDRPVHEVEQPALVPIDESSERLPVAAQMPLYDMRIVELVERLTLERAGGGRRWRRFEHCPHELLPYKSHGVRNGNSTGLGQSYGTKCTGPMVSLRYD